jgi:hypothetical protein
MTRHRLQLEDDNHFLTFGISCHLKDYRAAWHLNQLFHFDLVRSQFNSLDKLGQVHTYSVFKHTDEELKLNYVLVNNFSEDIPLIKSLRQFNLLLIVEGYIEIFDTDEFRLKLDTLEAFQFVTEVDSDNLKKHQHLLFEE